MKTILPIIICLFSFNSFAQPVIQDGNDIPPIGYSAPISFLLSSSSDITNGGANHTWDFSGYGFTVWGTSLLVIDPTAAPMASSFPTSNFAYSATGAYSFFNVSATKMEVQAWNIATAGVGNDYSPNPRTMLKFPFNFNDTVHDTWQKVGGSTNTVTLYYDSYGTLKMPGKTYNNVVRIRENYGGSANDYIWYTLNPLIQVAIYDHNTTTLYYFGVKEGTGISPTSQTATSIDLFPNPAQDVVLISGLPRGSSFELLDMTGRVIYQATAAAGQTQVNTSGFSNGLYMIRVKSKEALINKRFVVAR
ncbi:MAG: T9SS type A sorting domain-containing protein [Bacteroidetes bacterium]|nr:T9SS type A sorting domain-containing protein [Bacteroidota bacterium]